MGPKDVRYFARAKVGGKLIRQSLNPREVRWVPMPGAVRSPKPLKTVSQTTSSIAPSAVTFLGRGN
jgi:hypothetical protein